MKSNWSKKWEFILRCNQRRRPGEEAVETQLPEVEGEALHCQAGEAEQGSATAVAGRQQLAGSTGSRRRSFGIHRRRHRDRPRSTERRPHCSLLDCWRHRLRLGYLWATVAGDYCSRRHSHHHRHGSGRRAGHTRRRRNRAEVGFP